MMGNLLKRLHWNGGLKRPYSLMLLFFALFVLLAPSEPSGPTLVRHPYLQLPGANEMTIVWATRSPGVPLVSYGVGWTDRGFDDSGWLGPGDLAGAAAPPGVKDADSTLYARRSFSLQDPKAVEKLVLSVGLDDGSAVYLNGVEVAKPNDGNALQLAEGIDITALKHLLASGENVLAVQRDNQALRSPAFSPDLSLTVYMPGPATTIETGNEWRYFTSRQAPLVLDQAAQGASAFYPALGGYYQHQVTLTGLQPGTSYNYRVSLDSMELPAGDGLSFRTAPGTSYFSFVAFGDSGTGTSHQMEIKDRLVKEQFNLALLPGDIAYNDGTYAQFQNNYFDVYRELLGRVPFVPITGNHEYFTHSAQPFLDLFVLPRNGVPGQEERYYSFNHGNVHFVALDSERVTQAQADWLKSDLEASRQFWTVVYLHRPPFGEGAKHPITGPENTLTRTLLAPLFERYQVDLVLASHNHMYGRSVPLTNAQAGPPYAWATTIEEGGVVYVTTGGGGGRLYEAYTDEFHQPPGASFSEHHYTRVTIVDCVLTLTAIDKHGMVRDESNIDRCAESSRAKVGGKDEKSNSH